MASNKKSKVVLQRQLRYKFHRRIRTRLILDTIFLVLLICGLFYTFNRSFSITKSKVITYKEVSNVDYKVYLKDNNFYESSYLDKDMAYVASLVDNWGNDMIGDYGYSSVAAVVGATYPEQLQEIRKLAPHTFFLIPGYGAQGGKAEDIALAFDQNGIGGIVNASRSLMCAYKSDRWKDKFTEEQYGEATRAEAIHMRDELNEAIKNK